MTQTTALALTPGTVVRLDGGDLEFEVVKVGRGLKERAVTYRRADGYTFTITHLAATVVEVVR